MKVRILQLLAISVLFLSACSESKVENDYSVPTTYTFTDSEGNSTVSFPGQTARLNQLAEITTYLKSANIPGTALSEAQLLEMYSNNEGNGSDYFSADAKLEGKQLRNKTARGNENYINKFEGILKDISAASATTTTDVYDAEKGKIGVLKSGEKAYLVDAKGAEYTQLFEKGLMGAVLYDQIQNVYLGAEKMNVDNTNAVDSENGKYYTVMEHHWDEAFGYFTSATDFPTNGTDRFWGKYSTTVDGLLGTNATIMNAFLRGRAAIANGDMETRDAQIAIIRTELEKVSAATAIHYLNGGTADFSDDALRCHELSEAAAFIEALYFSADETATLNGSEIDALLENLKDEQGEYNFYDITLADIAAARDAIATAFGMEDIKTQL
jgi:hypothetical protein